MFGNNAGEVITNILEDWDVDHIYGIPGDSINNLVDALRKDEEKIKFIQVRHEEVAALSAAAYAKLTGKIGVCFSIAGPGAVHLMNGLYDAKLDKAPVLVLAGQVESAKIGTDAFQEINLERMFDDVAVFNERITNVEHLPALVHQAIRTAYAERGVAVLTIPDDIPLQKVKNDIRLRSDVYTEPELSPRKQDMDKAINMLNKAEKPVILAGQGTRGAREELSEFAKKTAAPVIVSLPGKNVLPDNHPHLLGNLGLIGTKPSYEAMEECDLLIMAGTSFPYREFLPDDVPAIQIDIRPTEIGKRYPVDVGLISDAKHIFKQLTERAEQNRNDNFLKACQENMQAWKKQIHEEETEQSTPIKPQQVIYHLQNIVKEDAVISTDVGNVTVWMARYFPISNQQFVISSWMATMGCGLPGAIAGKIANPDKQVVAVCGDGGFTMVMHDFVTAVRYELPMIIVILNNSRLGMIKYEQAEIGHLNYGTALADINFAEFAESCGGEGYSVEDYKDLKPTMEKAALSNKPVIVDVAIEEQPPLPGKITYPEVAGYSKHLVKEFFEKGKIEVPPLKKALKRMK